MNFKEATAYILLTAIGLSGVWYVRAMAGLASLGPASVPPPALNSVLVVAVIGFVALVVAGHVLVAIAQAIDNREVDDFADERDRLIDLKGEQLGGFVLGGCVLLALGLILSEQPMFWTVNALVAGLFVGEAVKQLRILAGYAFGWT